MRLQIKVFGVALATFASLAVADAIEATKVLQKVAHRTPWNSKSAITVDIDCDGKADYVLLSQTKDRATVGLVLGKAKGQKVFVQNIAIAKPMQESLCASPAELESESLDYDPTDAVGKLPGFKPSETCSAFILSGGECDSFHFYWDHQHHRLTWWRL